MTRLEDYRDKYRSVAFSRSDNGVLEVVLHTEGGPLVWGTEPHGELPDAFADIAADRDNRVVLLTGTGDRFCADRDDTLSALRSTADGWDRIYWEGKRLLTALLEIEVPVVAAVNGPARYHAELGVLADAVLAADTAVFQDKPHFTSDVVPGDGVQVVWQTLLGANRGRYFLLTGQELSAVEALRFGVVNEVLAPDALLPRARALAEDFATKSTLTLRYTRVALTGQLKRALFDELGYGLSLEGMALQSRATTPPTAR
jgi:enoyl-CoA hydratase/carnithine racemase